MPAAETKEKTVARDIRVDRIGFVQELEKLWTKDLKTTVKTSMVDKEIDIVEGDIYQGTLTASTSSSIDAKAFYKMLKQGRIKEADFISAISVSKSAAAAFLAPRELADISETSPGEPRFSITRKKGIDLTLAKVIAGIVEAAPLNAA